MDSEQMDGQTEVAALDSAVGDSLRRRLAAALLALGVAACLAGVAGSVVVLLVPFNTVREVAAALSVNGNATTVTEPFVASLRLQAATMALLLAAGSLATVTRWQRWQRVISGYLPSTAGYSNVHGTLAISRSDAIGLAAIAALATAFRMIRMQGVMEFDESFTFLQYGQNPLYAVAIYNFPNNHIFHSLLVSLLTPIFGPSPWSVRLVAFTSGLALVPLTFVAARCAGPRALAGRMTIPIGWLAAAIVATHPLTVEYSANARGYTLQTLLTLGTWMLTAAVLRGRRDLLLVLSTLCALALWTIPTSLYAVLGIKVSLLWRALRDRQRTAVTDAAAFVILTAAITLLLWAPALLASGWRNVLFNPYVAPEGQNDPLLFRSIELTRALAAMPGGVAAVTATLVLATGAALASPRWRMQVASLAISIAALTVALRYTPPERVWIFAIPMGAILTDVAFCRLLQRFRDHLLLPRLACASAAALYVWLMTPALLEIGPRHDTVRQAADQLAARWSPGESIDIVTAANRSTTRLPYTFYNPWSLRFYLRERGVPNNASKASMRDARGPDWLVAIDCDRCPDAVGHQTRKGVEVVRIASFAIWQLNREPSR